MRKNNNHKEIDTLDFEVKNQELSGKSGSGWFTAVQLTLAGRCGLCFTCSYECTTNNVRCQIKQKVNSSILLQNIDNTLIQCYIYKEKYK